VFFEIDNRREKNVRSRLSVVLGLIGLIIVPTALILSNKTVFVTLVKAVIAITVTSTICGILSLILAQRGRMKSAVTLGRVGGRTTSAVGRFLGTLSLAIGASGGIALAVYGLLQIKR